MQIAMLLKTIAVWVMIAAAEVLNGNVRVRYLQLKFGQHRGKRISFFSGVLLFSTISWIFIPWIGPGSILECLAIGSIWVFLMTALDVYFGRFVFRYSWQKIMDDFNPGKGNLLSLGMILLFFCPTLVFLLR